MFNQHMPSPEPCEDNAIKVASCLAVNIQKDSVRHGSKLDEKEITADEFIEGNTLCY